MAHNIDSYIGRQPAWHELGKVTGQYMTWEDIQNSGNLNYGVEKRQLEWNGQPVNAWATFRTDNNACFGSVGEDYTVLHHNEGFKMLDSLVESQNGAHYETAGSLGQGEIVWGLVDLNMTIHVGDDKSENYLLFSTAHDGSRSHAYRITSTRVVCQNTLNIATRAAAALSVRHTKNAEKRLASMHKALEVMHGEVSTLENKLRFLADRKVTRESLDTIMERLFPKQKNEDGSPKDSTRRNNIISEILACYENNDGNAYPDQRGTAYNLLNAVTEYVDHKRGSDPAKRTQNSMFGSGDTIKSQALEIITLQASSMPDMPVRQIITPVVSAPLVTQPTGILDWILEGVE